MPSIGIEDQPNSKDYWYGELRSLGIEPKQTSDFNDTRELRDLTENLKETLYQDYKTAYDKKTVDP